MLFGTAERHASLLFLVATIAWGGCESPISQGATIDAAQMREADAGEPKRPTVLPGGYVPNIRCGDLGNTCSAKTPCTEGLSCQAGVCLPDPQKEQTASCLSEACPANAPFCSFGVCVTADELACLCLNPDARDNVFQCRAVREAKSDAGTACLPEDSLCDTDPDACCEGLTCMQGSDGSGRRLLGICKRSCEEGTSCPDRCCTETIGVAGKFCGPKAQCPNDCRSRDEACDAVDKVCCGGLVCSQSASDPDLDGCKVPCTKHSACDSKCCVLFHDAQGAQLDHGVCAPASRCAAPQE